MQKIYHQSAKNPPVTVSASRHSVTSPSQILPSNPPYHPENLLICD
ncbi:hypothetical protein ACE01C_05040 [Moraxella sp. ZJ171]